MCPAPLRYRQMGGAFSETRWQLLMSHMFHCSYWLQVQFHPESFIPSWNLSVIFRFPKGVTNGHRPKCLSTQLDRPTTNQSNKMGGRRSETSFFFTKALRLVEMIPSNRPFLHQRQPSLWLFKVCLWPTVQ